jgi:putative hydrolase of the HAD superfamily
MTNADPIEVVLFDVGGILIKMSGIDIWKRLTGLTDEAEVWRRWLHCPVVQAFERGHSSSDEFARGMVETHGLPVGTEEFLDSFRTWPGGLFDGARELVEDVAGHLRKGCFSNTNEVHWTEPCNQTIHKLFELHFLSYEMGRVKPDAEAFHHVAETLDCAPGAIFFIDDNIINVDAARACGFEAQVAKGPEESRRVLADRGLMKV